VEPGVALNCRISTIIIAERAGVCNGVR